MALKDIMAISGYSGLFKFVSQGRNGIIVESMSDGKRSHIPASAKVSALSDISVFTTDGEMPLHEILDSIKKKENSGPTISHKSSNDELKSFFESVVPNYDSDRVYVSDIKKMVSWYNQLQAANILDFEPEEEQPEAKKESDAEAKMEPEKVEKAKPAAKKAPAKKKTDASATKKASSAKVKSASAKNVANKPKTSTNKKSG